MLSFTHLLGDVTIYEQMSDTFLSHGSNPYTPDKSGEFLLLSFLNNLLYNL